MASYLVTGATGFIGRRPTGAGDDTADDHETARSQLARNLTKLVRGVHW